MRAILTLEPRSKASAKCLYVNDTSRLSETLAMLEFFQRHPRSVGETYFEHMGVATSFGVLMVVGGMACLVHAIIPAWFEHTASRVIATLYTRMVSKRRRRPDTMELDYAI